MQRPAYISKKLYKPQVLLAKIMSSPTATNENLAIVSRFKRFYADCCQLQVDEMDQLYHNDVIFKDPLNHLRGLPSLHRYMAELSATVSECRFEYLDEIVSDRAAYIKWNMHYRHPKLGNKRLVLRGVTQIQFGERIIYHEDIYDMGQMLYEHIPFLGAAIRWFKSRLTVTV